MTMTIEEYSAFDATGLAELIRSGDLAVAELHEVGTQAVQLADKHLQTNVEGPWSSPLDSSGDGVFAGAPFVLKDILCHAAGVPMHMGCRAFAKGVVLEHDSELMARFRRAGLAALCTTKTPEFALNITTEPLLGGPALNPWDPAKSPGGSSGASAALVAAGAVPVAHGNDGGGSLRIPANYTGTIGLKPSRGRVPIGPGMQEGLYGNSVEFAITRSVRDTAALLDAVCGNHSGEKYFAPRPERPYLEELNADRTRLRIAVCSDSWTEKELHRDVAQAIELSAKTLEGLGHDVAIVRPALDWEAFLDALTAMICAATAAMTVPIAEELGIGLSPDYFEATTIALADAGRTMTPIDLARAFAINNVISRQLAHFMSGWDILVTPVSITPPVDLGTFNSDDASVTVKQWVRHIISHHPTTALYNVTGAPALSLPLGTSSDGLPIGVQFGADNHREDLLIGLAAQLEQAMPWSDRRPNLHVSNLERLS